jgi:hypothetical protein
MPDALAIVFLVFHVLSWPLVKLANAVIILLSPIWTLVAFLLLPFVHLARVFVNIASFPFKTQWLERIEVTMLRSLTAPSKTLQTLYIYLGTATLIGGLTGGVLFAIYSFLSSSLNIDPATPPAAPDQGRTPAEFQAARREKQHKAVNRQPPTPVLLDKPPSSRRRGLLSQTIDEEEDSDY